MPAVGATHGTLLHAGSRPLPTSHGPFTLHLFQNLATRAAVLAAVAGDPRGARPVPARVHSSCVTSEGWGGADCDCARQLDEAFARVAAAGRGLIVYLMQEGRGAGFSSKIRDRMLVQASGGRLTTFDAYARMGLRDDHRRYDEVAFARRLLGIEAPFRLLTNNPEKVRALEEAGVPVAGTERLRPAASPFALAYLRAKRRAGHRLGAVGEGVRAVAPPERVEQFAPGPVPGVPGAVQLASYLLPLSPAMTAADEPPVWLRVYAHLDLAAARERVLLSYATGGTGTMLVRIQREQLLERLPLAAPRTHRVRWERTVRAFARHGAGVALVGSDDPWGAFAGDDGAPRPPSRTAGALLARHLAGRPADLLLARDEAAAEPALRHALAAAGVGVEAVRWLDDAA